MLLAGLFLTFFARSVASPTPISVPSSTIPSPICVVSAAITASECDPTKYRTIFGILYSCLGVIILCTHISIHPNIPDQDSSCLEVLWLTFRTTFYATIAPEMVILWAMRQKIMAGRIAKENEHRGWTQTHEFFVQMGGLIQRTRHEKEVVYQVAGVTTGKEGPVNWDGIKIPHIPEKEIRDRGKGDVLAKAIVVVQTTWFVAQCIARHAQGLVLTEIELVTLAFATLNVVTYGLWWDKPLNVGYPIYSDEEGNRVDGPRATIGTSEGSWYGKIWSSMRLKGSVELS
ncbi:hypothetical protein AX16_004645 [Volvariella volvacea WC 439]|nr:hypothetical protein AX16_004645 [Volvariella volvacea WC 439]